MDSASGVGNARRRKYLPHRHAASPVYRPRLGQHIFRPLEPGERDIGQIGFGIAADEIENSVSARICSGRKR